MHAAGSRTCAGGRGMQHCSRLGEIKHHRPPINVLLHRPKRVPARLSITWDVTDGTPSADYSFILTTLAEGKTVADLDGLIGAGAVRPPSWLTFTRYSQLTAQTTTETFDLSANAAYHGEPIYVLCLSHQVTFAVVGPIKVKE
jgi:hypothetical protein